jgi:hypothetical protein
MPAHLVTASFDFNLPDRLQLCVLINATLEEKGSHICWKVSQGLLFTMIRVPCRLPLREFTGETRKRAAGFLQVSVRTYAGKLDALQTRQSGKHRGLVSSDFSALVIQYSPWR